MKALFSLITFCFLMNSCSPSTLPTQTRNPDEIRFAFCGAPLSLDPRIGGDSFSLIITRLLFEGITRLGENGTPVLALASSYTLSNDGLTYTFTLRPSKWSNGQNVTSFDFVYAWKSVLTQSVPSAYGYVYFIIKNAQKVYQGTLPAEMLGIKALDPYILEVTLEHPAPYFLELLSNPLFSPLYCSITEHHSQETNNEYVSNGPFVLFQNNCKSSIILKKNPLYWDRDSVKSETLSFIVLEDPLSLYNLFRSGSLDWYGDPFVPIPLEISHELSETACLHKTPNNRVKWLICNTRNKFLSSPHVRRALAMSIDRTTLCKNLLQNEETPSYSFVQQPFSFFHSQAFIEDPFIAKTELKEALTSLGYKDGKCPTLHLLIKTNSLSSLVCQALQYQLMKNLDVDVKIDLCDASMFIPLLNSGNFDLAFVSWYSWFSDPLYTLNYLKETNNGINGTGWHSQEYVSLIDSANKELDSGKRDDFLRKAEALAMNEMPIIPISLQASRYAKNNITGEIFSSIGALDLKRIHRVPTPHNEKSA